MNMPSYLSAIVRCVATICHYLFALTSLISSLLLAIFLPSDITVLYF